MSTWIMEPGHTEVEFQARHMMVTWVRGLFKDIHGTLEFDWDKPLDATQGATKVGEDRMPIRSGCSSDAGTSRHA